MKYIRTNWDIPYYNMAFENYVMNSDKLTDDYIFFYIHKPSVIIGKHQNTIEEINSKYIKENDIIVARRNTGGGAVYHDEGNLNFSFIVNKKSDNQEIDFKEYTMPIINTLKKLGVDAYLSGRNDILVDGKKISGNAQGMNKKKILSHGTLMYDVNVEALVNALNVSSMKIESKAIKSVRSRVLNIKDYLKEEIDIYKFKELILEEIFSNSDTEEYILDEEDYSSIQKLVDEKYSTWEFNYGYSPKFSLNNKNKFENCGLIEVNLDIKGGMINDIFISGDYFALKETEELCNYLKGEKFKEENIRKKLDKINLNDYITNLKNDQFLSLLFD